MIIGLGTDVLEIDRMGLAMKRRGERFQQRVFTEAEVAHCRRRKNQAESFAVRFAVKEATLKAMGRGLFQGVALKDIGVVHDQRGKPDIKLTGGGRKRFEEMGGKSISVSMTHSGLVAFAVVIIEG